MSTPADFPARAAALIAELLPLARVYAGTPDGTAPAIQAITFAFDDRLVDARQTRDGGWAFALRGPGRGRRPGTHAARLKRDYDTALADARGLQRQLRGATITAATIQSSRWLRKLVLSWQPAVASDVPAWLQSHVEDTWLDADRTPPRFVIRVPLPHLPDKRLRTPIKDPTDGAALTFENESTDVTWNQFTRGDFIPSDLAARMVGIYHAQPTKRGRKVPLSPSYVRRQKAPSRA